MTEPVIDRSCGPEGCEIDWLASPRVEVDAEFSVGAPGTSRAY